MLAFLQGFSYGLFLSCLPWLVIGLASPHRALGTLRPTRLQAVARYGLAVPFVAGLLWLTSLWGGFGPSLGGWLAGLGAVAVAVPLERRWRLWRQRRRQRREKARRERESAARRAEQARQARQRGEESLDPAQPPADADDVTLALCEAKKRLLAARQPAVAGQADQLYGRYRKAMAVLLERFDPGELAFERARSLVAEVCLTAVDNLTAMAARASGVAGVDAESARRRLAREGERLSQAERLALERRLALVEDTRRQLSELGGRNEAALTALDNMAVAMARVDTRRPQASVSADQALDDLQRFVAGAERYSRRS
ncbi:cobyrinic acid a,c-diamide synthase [Halomonas piscis]|uniref:Cobyrinic acid a,c-diamide synthase n=1 Tax=Halomonas piscis TaxID=3031727 RepID=A0ABY9Z2B0_9GAMM|nr:cobyrinic acid a,c-diamide synthase [Halomonas piscis]WNK21271.1 cobyrinic acid a,c-diamide synthase [Halomonas piscis]